MCYYYATNQCRRASYRACSPATPVRPAQQPLAYGGVYNAASGTIAMNGAGVATPITIMDAAMPLKDVTTAASALVVKDGGTYRINYSASYADAVYAYVRFYVESNGVPVPGSYTQRNTIPNQVENAAQSVLFPLPAGAVVRLMSVSDNGGSRLYFDREGVDLEVERVAP
ncbi:MAG: hypothetical protein LBG83_06535 [Oscillospiraceae bacterium]|jgi:hypothetical protein|nr:hypothetical protein [Oscillospiraceae bacterium]